MVRIAAEAASGAGRTRRLARLRQLSLRWLRSVDAMASDQPADRSTHDRKSRSQSDAAAMLPNRPPRGRRRTSTATMAVSRAEVRHASMIARGRLAPIEGHKCSTVQTSIMVNTVLPTSTQLASTRTTWPWNDRIRSCDERSGGASASIRGHRQ